jgi:hypothetical protein
MARNAGGGKIGQAVWEALSHAGLRQAGLEKNGPARLAQKCKKTVRLTDRFAQLLAQIRCQTDEDHFTVEIFGQVSI